MSPILGWMASVGLAQGKEPEFVGDGRMPLHFVRMRHVPVQIAKQLPTGASGTEQFRQPNRQRAPAELTSGAKLIAGARLTIPSRMFEWQRPSSPVRTSRDKSSRGALATTAPNPDWIVPLERPSRKSAITLSTLCRTWEWMRALSGAQPPQRLCLATCPDGIAPLSGGDFHAALSLGRKRPAAFVRKPGLALGTTWSF